MSQNKMAQNNIYELGELTAVWLQRTQKIAKKLELDRAISDLDYLNRTKQLSRFRVGVIGEPNSGKSTLINQLVGADVLPTSVLPNSTPVMTHLLGTVENEKMAIWSEEKLIQERPISLESWNGVKKKELDVKIHLENAWSQTNQIELIDTYNLHKVSDAEHIKYMRLLNSCDMVLVVINGLAPLKITEKQFVERRLKEFPSNPIIICLTHLDRVHDEEKSEVLDDVQQNLMAISSQLTVLPTHSIDGKDGNSAVELIREEIKTAATDPERFLARSKQATALIQAQLVQLELLCQAGLDTTLLDEKQRQKEIEKIEQETRIVEEKWRTLRAALEEKRLDNTKRIRQELTKRSAEFEKKLSFYLEMTKDPQKWVEIELTHHIEVEASNASKILERELEKAAFRDFRWLQQELAKQFGARVDQDTYINPTVINDVGDLVNEDIELVSGEKMDSTRRNLGTYAMVSAAGILFMAGALPYIIIAAPISRFTTDRIYATFQKRKISANKKEIKKELTPISMNLYDYFSKIADTESKQIYDDFTQKIKTQEKNWLDNRLDLLKIPEQDDQFRNLYEENFEAIQGLQEEIKATLNLMP